MMIHDFGFYCTSEPYQVQVQCNTVPIVRTRYGGNSAHGTRHTNFLGTPLMCQYSIIPSPTLLLTQRESPATYSTVQYYRRTWKLDERMNDLFRSIQSIQSHENNKRARHKSTDPHIHSQIAFLNTTVQYFTRMMFRSTMLSRSRRLVGSLIETAPCRTSRVATPTTRSLHCLAAAASASANTITTASTTTVNSFPQVYPNMHQQYRTVFIQTENTPNPESIKFVPTDTTVVETEDGTGYYVTKTSSLDDILKSPLCTQLFKLDGVKAVYLGADFVTITKYAEAKWQLMRPEIFSCLMDFFESGQAALVDQPIITDTTILDDDDEIVAMIKELIEQRIRPAVQEDGGDIRYVSFDEHDGLVTVQLAGSCVGCPSSAVTLKAGVENMLMHYVPEVTSVIALDDEEEEEEEAIPQKSYEERLAAAGIPFSD
jgi:Fe-S cluster biogenesis protein NfuA